MTTLYELDRTLVIQILHIPTFGLFEQWNYLLFLLQLYVLLEQLITIFEYSILALQ